MYPDLPVEDRMQAIVQEWEDRQDRRALFLTCYRMMTTNLKQAITAGEFNDADWVNQLMEHFAAYYFFALDAYEKQAPQIPQAWQIAFDAAQRPDVSVIQNLLLGINAHINHDLVYSLVDMLEGEWQNLAPEGRRLRLADHEHVNDIIGSTIDTVQTNLLEADDRRWDILDKLLGPVDEWLLSKVISEWREQVWEGAIQLLESQDEASREEIRQALLEKVIDRANLMI